MKVIDKVQCCVIENFHENEWDFILMNIFIHPEIRNTECSCPENNCLTCHKNTNVYLRQKGNEIYGQIYPPRASL